MPFVKQIETLFRSGTAGGLTDAQLLERFLERRDDVARQRSLPSSTGTGQWSCAFAGRSCATKQDAEDAAQATFLVLARRAGTIGRRDSVPSWLHGVALRVAANARTAAIRRRAHEHRGGEMRAAVASRRL